MSKEETLKAVNSRVLKIDEDKRLVIGVVLEPETVDLQDDIISAEDVEKAAHGYLMNSRVVGYSHQEKADASVVESYIAMSDFYLDGTDTIKKGSWIMVVKVHNDELWKQVKEGEINSFSIGGWGDRTPIDENIVAGGDSNAV